MLVTEIGCGICRKAFERSLVGAHAWTGEPICEACANTFADCAFCRRHMEPHQERKRDGLVACPACGPHQSNRNIIRKHPAVLADEALSREFTERLAREP